MFDLLKRRQRHLLDEDLSVYLDRRLPSGQVRRVESHLATCPDCRHRLDELAELSAALRALPETPAPRSFRLTPEQLRATERPRPATVTGRLYPVLRTAAAAGAVLLFATVGADVFLRVQEEPVSEQPAAALMERERTEGAEEFGAGQAGSVATDEANAGRAAGEEDKSLTGESPDGLTPPAPVAAGPLDGDDGTDLAELPPETPLPATAPAEAPHPASADAQADEQAEEEGRPWLLALEVALGVAVVGLAGGALLLRRRRNV